MNVRKSMIHAVAALSVAVSSAAAGAAGSVQFMDLQWLQPGVAVHDAGSYFSDKLQPLVRKHGGNIMSVHQIAATMRGEVKPALVATMEFPSMEKMQGLLKDPEYQKLIPQRDATFDLPKQSLFQIKPIPLN